MAAITRGSLFATDTGMSIEDTTGDIIGCSIAIHRKYGPGMLESVYKRCLGVDLLALGYDVAIEEPVALTHNGLHIPRAFVVDLFVNREVIVEVKCVAAVLPIHVAQVRTYLRLTNTQLGLILNFNVHMLKHGIHRVANNYQEPVERKRR